MNVRRILGVRKGVIGNALAGRGGVRHLLDGGKERKDCGRYRKGSGQTWSGIPGENAEQARFVSAGNLWEP